MMHLPCRHRDDDYRTSGSISFAPQPIQRHRSRQRSRTDTNGTSAPYQVERPRSAFYTPLEKEKSVIPDNPFQPVPPPQEEEPIQRRSYVTEDGSAFEPPATAQLPEWYRVAQHNVMPADDLRRQTVVVQRAPVFETEPEETSRDPLGRPMRRPTQAETKRDTSIEEFYQQAGYPQELVEEQRRLSEEQARIRSCRTHGAMQAAPRQQEQSPQNGMPQRRPLTEEEKQRRAAAAETVYKQRNTYSPFLQSENAALERRESPYEQPVYDRGIRVQETREENRYRRQAVSAVEQENGMMVEDYIDEEIPFWKNSRLWLAVGVFVFALLAAVLFAMEKTYIAETESILANRQKAQQATQSKYFLQYQDWIEREAAKNNLHPAFVAAIIFNESTFRPGVESSVGARGLMQVMEETSGDIAHDLHVDPYTFDMLYDPETNIIFGCYYLGRLSQRFRGDPICVAAAYHAGAQQVQNWLNTSKYSSDGQTLILSNMNDGPTTQYAARVNRDFAIYRQLYFEEVSQ